jgi:hypothetical protein
VNRKRSRREIDLGEASSEEVQSAIARSGLRVRDRSFEFGRSGFSRI